MPLTDIERDSMTLEDMIDAWRCWVDGKEYIPRSRVEAQQESNKEVLARHPWIMEEAERRRKRAYDKLRAEADKLLADEKYSKALRASDYGRETEAFIGVSGGITGTGNLYAAPYTPDPRPTLERGYEAYQKLRLEKEEQERQASFRRETQRLTSVLDGKAYTADEIRNMSFDAYQKRRQALLADAADGRIDGFAATDPAEYADL